MFNEHANTSCKETGETLGPHKVSEQSVSNKNRWAAAVKAKQREKMQKQEWVFSLVMKTPVQMPAFHPEVGRFHSCPPAPDSSFLLMQTLGGSTEGSSNWDPGTHMLDLG